MHTAQHQCMSQKHAFTLIMMMVEIGPEQDFRT